MAINKNLRNNYMHKSIDNISSVAYQNKKDFYDFNPNPDVEEIPTFSFENDKNLNNYKGNIYNKEALIEQNSKNYISYMKKFERRKTPISTPYAVYKEFTKNNYNNYSYNKININNSFNNRNNINELNNISKIINNNYIINKKDIQNNNNTLNQNSNERNDNINETKPLSNSMSAKAIIFDNRKSEITNPDLFYKRNNNDYNKYRAEQKKYLDYNYKILMNKNKLHDKQEPNINPYNPKYEDFEHYKSNLVHNPILNPVNYYSYNKYLKKEIIENNNKRYQNDINNNINNYNLNNKRKFSPFHNAGNQIFNK